MFDQENDCLRSSVPVQKLYIIIAQKSSAFFFFLSDFLNKFFFYSLKYEKTFLNIFGISLAQLSQCIFDNYHFNI